MREVGLCKGQEVGTDDETCINNREVPEACILENNGPYDSKVNVRGGKLSDDGRLVRAGRTIIDRKYSSHLLPTKG